MKWIKASERLPENGEQVFIKCDNEKMAAIFNDNIWCDDLMYPIQDYENIEWLDETPSPPMQELKDWIEKLQKDFAEWLTVNTSTINEPKITLYRYHDSDGWGNYILDDIYTVYREKSPIPNLLLPELERLREENEKQKNDIKDLHAEVMRLIGIRVELNQTISEQKGEIERLKNILEGQKAMNKYPEQIKPSRTDDFPSYT